MMELIVTYSVFYGKGKQLSAYNDAIKKYNKQTKYMAFIDLDEFILPHNQTRIGNVVDDIISKDQNAGGITLNWRMFGSSGHLEKPKGGTRKLLVSSTR